MGIGVAAKYSLSDAFALKARVLAELMGGVTPKSGDKAKYPTFIVFEVQPAYSISDRVTIFADIGLNMATHKNYDKARVGIHFNPYVQIGNEWGPSFFGGFKLWTEPKQGDKTPVNWAVPIALNVAF
jgi:hypothetical protein